MKRDASWRSAALMVAIVAVGGCGIGCNDYVCAPVTITLADAETGEPVSDSEVVVAWVDALEGLEAESYLASHGEPVGATDDEGHIGVEICGHWVLVPYAPSEKFVLTHHVAILGVTRDTGDAADVVIIEFEDAIGTLGAAILPTSVLRADRVNASDLDSILFVDDRFHEP